MKLYEMVVVISLLSELVLLFQKKAIEGDVRDCFEARSYGGGEVVDFVLC